jgi:hypothetical protein
MNILELAKALNIQQNTKLTFTDPIRTGLSTPFCSFYIIYSKKELSLIDYNAVEDCNFVNLYFKPLNIDLS